MKGSFLCVKTFKPITTVVNKDNKSFQFSNVSHTGFLWYLDSFLIFFGTLFRRRRSFTWRKLYACLEKFLCSVQLSDRAYVSRVFGLSTPFYTMFLSVDKLMSLYLPLQFKYVDAGKLYMSPVRRQ